LAKKYYETDKFKKREALWYAKLKADGFQDIDNGNTNVVPKQRFEVIPEYVEYFFHCEKYLKSGEITDKRDLFIFECHCLGLSDYEIVPLLKENKLLSATRQTVYNRIIAILKKAKIEPMDFGKK
jgi:hypothetical protein